MNLDFVEINKSRHEATDISTRTNVEDFSCKSNKVLENKSAKSTFISHSLPIPVLFT